MAMPIGRRSHCGHSSVRNMAMQQADRNRDQHGDERGHQRAVDRRQRAELLGDRIPALGHDEAEAERLQRRQRADRSGR